MDFKIYTKQGDDGKTALIGGERVSKHHIRVESYGTVDELNSHIGVVRSKISGSQEELLLAKFKTICLPSDLFWLQHPTQTNDCPKLSAMIKLNCWNRR